MAKTLIVVGFFILACLSQCSEPVDDIENRGSLDIYGTQGNGQMRTLVSHPDGGFVIGSHIWQNGQRDVLIKKYSADFALEWDKTIGGSYQEQLDKILIDDAGNILIAGIYPGFGEDTIRSTDYIQNTLYVQLMDPSGIMLWESRLADMTSWSNARSTTDIIQKNDGNYLVCCNLNTRLQSQSPEGSIFLLDKNGNIKASVTLALHAIEGILETNLGLTGFSNTISEAYSFQIDDASVNGSLIIRDLKKSNSWPWSTTSISLNTLEQIKSTGTDNDWSFNYFFTDAIHQFRMKENVSSIDYKKIEEKFGKITSANPVRPSGFILANEEGTVFKVDDKFEIINSFDIELIRFQSTTSHIYFTQLNGGNLICAFEKDRTFYVINMDKDGEII